MARSNQHAHPDREYAFFTAEESSRFRALRVRLCSQRAAIVALDCTQMMFETACGQGRVMPSTRDRMLAKLARLELAETGT